MTPSALPTPMTAHADTRSPAERMTVIADTAPQPQAAATCSACPHPVARHDALGLRYCRATLTGAGARGCICQAT